MTTPDELRQAVIDFKNGNRQAFDNVYTLSKRYIIVCIRNVMNKQDNAEDVINDILQDTYLEVSKNINQLNNESEFLSWAATISNRKCFAWLKKNNKYKLEQEEDNTLEKLADNENFIPETIMQDREKQRLFKEIIENELSDVQKLCVVGFFYNEQKQSEIAETLGIPVNTVKTNLSRAKVKIKDAVLRLEKEKGTRLYSVAPFLLLLFQEEIQECFISQSVSDTIINAVASSTNSLQHSVVEEATKEVVKEVAKETVKRSIQLTIKTKVLIGVIGVAIIGTIGTTVFMNQSKALKDSTTSSQIEEVENDVATTVPTVEPTIAPTPEPTVEPVKEEKWAIACKELLSQKPDGEILGFDLKDMDVDGIPELLVKTDIGDNYADILIYKFVENSYQFVYESSTVGEENYEIGYSTIGYGKNSNEIIDIRTMQGNINDNAYNYKLGFLRTYQNGTIMDEYGMEAEVECMGANVYIFKYFLLPDESAVLQRTDESVEANQLKRDEIYLLASGSETLQKIDDWEAFLSEKLNQLEADFTEIVFTEIENGKIDERISQYVDVQ